MDTYRAVEKVAAAMPAHGGEPLSAKLAQRIFHETGVSLEWLRAGDPTAPAVSARGEPYTQEIFKRNQAEKKYYDRPHPFFQNSDALNVCARLVSRKILRRHV